MEQRDLQKVPESEGKETTVVNKLILAMRESGFVKRCHTCRTIGEYTNAEHQWQCLVLLSKLHPDPSKELIWAVAFHDVAERYLGDMPASVGWFDPALKRQQNLAEQDASYVLGLGFDLKPEDDWWLKSLDRLELLLWAEDQKALGNKHVNNLNTVVREWFRKEWQNIPQPVQNFISTYEWTRTSDIELPSAS
jgi:hypothetical protein